jgi:TRAP-type C4-dicarboxylate transport system permease small subunit
MKSFMNGIFKVDKILYTISGIVLCLMILLTLCDVILRNFGHPITGSLEIMQYGGCIVFSFSIPYATWNKAQIIVDMIIEKLSPGKKKVLNIVTRCIGILLFLFIAGNALKYGLDVRHTGESTSYFRIALFPFAYILTFAFLFQSLTILCDLINAVKGGDNE